MVTFRCKRSGNLVSFINPDDIKELRSHESYTEEIENGETKTIKDANEKDTHANEENAHEENGAQLLEISKVAPVMEQPPARKKRGRPKKR